MTTTLVEIKDLNITFDFNNQTVKAVKKSNFKILKGECLAIVGESGSGKSVTALSIMKLIRSNSQLKISGDVIYEKKNLLHQDELNLQKIRGKKISMIFQEPMTSLNPLHTIEKQISECFDNDEKSNITTVNAIEMGYFADEVDLIVSGGISKGYRTAWYDPNSHVYTIQNYGNGTSFGHLKLKVDSKHKKGLGVGVLPNLLGETAIYHLTRNKTEK